MRTAALVLLFAALLVAQQGSVEGVVLNQAGGQPLPGVHVRLFAGIVVEAATEAYGAVTDAGGRFSIAAMPPGNYTVELEGAGFLQVPGNAGYSHGTEIAVRPGEHVAGCQLEMFPLIPIAGRVVNQYGDPVPNVRVGVTTASANSRPVTGPFSLKTTDERGQFRLFTAPGKYYVVAEPPYFPPGMGSAEIRADGTSDLAYAVTYYPDSPDASSAAMVEAKPGSGVTGLEIDLRSGAARRDLTVSGVVTGVPAGGQARVSYRYGASPGQFQAGADAVLVGADGGFSLHNFSPGYVRLLAQCSSGDTELQSDLVDIHLEPPGATDVQLALAPGGAVTGTLEIVGEDRSAASAGKLTVRLSPIEFGLGMPPPSVAVGRDGAFRIAGVPPGRFSLYVDVMPEDAYIKAILLDNVAVNNRTLDFSRGVRGSRLKVAISRNGARISGEVRAADGAPLLNSHVMAFLAPEPNQIAPARSAVPVVDGQYQFRGVPPGKYKIYAADSSKVTPAARPAFLAAGETLEVLEGAHVARNLSVIPPEEPNANPK
ncbi:MAG: carboxypeptidase-like regulatory domain-containing protein [Bryobacteraceae bacterium]|jgi:hypothetical protein